MNDLELDWGFFMNELLRNVLTRRSAHKFSSQQIKDQELNEIIEAGKFVSSAIKSQTWHFTVIQNKGLLEKISSKNSKFFLQYGHDLFKENYSDDNLNFLKNAPTLLIISGANDDVETQDAANATFGNMMLAAEKIGVSACWTHSLKLLFDSEEGKDLANTISIPSGYVPLCAGVFGYKATVSASEPPTLKDGIIHIIK